MILQQQECRCRIDAQHRRLGQIEARRDGDRVFAADAAALKASGADIVFTRIRDLFDLLRARTQRHESFRSIS